MAPKKLVHLVRQGFGPVLKSAVLDKGVPRTFLRTVFGSMYTLHLADKSTAGQFAAPGTFTETLKSKP